jgi:RimJ/RimL family protein N-acetyltransferase
MKPHWEYPQPPWIETPRLRLRPMHESDAALIVAWRNSPETLQMMEQQVPITLESHLAWFRSPRLGRVDYVMLRRDTDAVIGVLSFKNIEEGAAESGRVIGDLASRGQGLALESAEAWFRYGFEVLGLRRIIGITHHRNEANIRLNSKLGYQEDAEEAKGEFVRMTLSIERWRQLHIG